MKRTGKGADEPDRLEWYRHMLQGSGKGYGRSGILDVIETRGELYDTIGQMGTFDAQAK